MYSTFRKSATKKAGFCFIAKKKKKWISDGEKQYPRFLMAKTSQLGSRTNTSPPPHPPPQKSKWFVPKIPAYFSWDPVAEGGKVFETFTFWNVYRVVLSRVFVFSVRIHTVVSLVEVIVRISLSGQGNESLDKIFVYRQIWPFVTRQI